MRWPCRDEPGKPARYFWGMAVDASHRRQGAGRRLLAAVAGQANAAGEFAIA
ncbi:GNAT family N-acetyltransferase [Micromonospora globispora]|uniref:GNAT family N-acetyltransferase n=1 Tax=Micromonospora globispora TaxID=1450148 RepID=UPI003C6D09E7